MLQDLDHDVKENRLEPVNDFLRSKYSTGCRPATVSKYSKTLKKFFHDYYPRLDASDIQVNHVEKFLQGLEQDFDSTASPNGEMSQKTKRDYLSHISSFYTWALKRPKYEDITSNPASVVLEDIPRQRREAPDVATWENAEKVVRSMPDPRNRTAAVIMAKTGCRVGEVCQIRIEDLRLDDGFIVLNERKGGKRGVVPIDGEAINQIKRFKVMRERSSHPYLFVSRHGNRLSTDRIRDKVRQAAVKAGIMDEGETDYYRCFTPHCFRYAFTTLMRNQGMKDHYISYIRGDADQKGMLDWYTRIDRDRVRQEYLNHIKNLRL